MQKDEFTVLIEKDKDGWLIGSVVELPGCHTQAKSYDELMERIKEAIALYSEVRGKREKSTEFLGIQRLTIQNA